MNNRSKARILEQIRSIPEEDFIPTVFNDYIILSNHGCSHIKYTRYYGNGRTTFDIALSQNSVELFDENHYRYLIIAIEDEDGKGKTEAKTHSYFVRADILAIGTMPSQPHVTPIGRGADYVPNNPSLFKGHFREIFHRLSDEEFAAKYQRLQQKEFKIGIRSDGIYII